MLNMKLLILGSVRVENRTVQCTRWIDDHHPRDFSISFFHAFAFSQSVNRFSTSFSFLLFGFWCCYLCERYIRNVQMSQYEQKGLNKRFLSFNNSTSLPFKNLSRVLRFAFREIVKRSFANHHKSLQTRAHACFVVE